MPSFPLSLAAGGAGAGDVNDDVWAGTGAKTGTKTETHQRQSATPRAAPAGPVAPHGTIVRRRPHHEAAALSAKALMTVIILH